MKKLGGGSLVVLSVLVLGILYFFPDNSFFLWLEEIEFGTINGSFSIALWLVISSLGAISGLYMLCE